jgi:glycosyltransferase involved in cell wall biosynthesis
MTKVVFVNRYFHPDFSATSQMLSDLAFALAAEGFDVTVVASRQIYDAPAAQLPKLASLNGVAVHRVASTTFGRGSAAGRLLDYLTFHLAAAWKLLHLLRRGDVVVAKTDPPLLSVTVALIAHLRGAVLVNWLQDLFPEVLGAIASKGRAAQWPIGVLRALRNRSLRRARRNVVVGERMGRYVTAQGVSAQAVEVIENWCDGRIVQPLSRESNPLRAAWGLSRSFVVGYSGNLGAAHEFDTIIDAAEQLRGRDDVVFLFIGAGSRLAHLQAEAQRRGLSNVMFQPYQSREKLTESLSVPDAHLVCLRPDMEGLVVPSKLYGVLAAGRPCLFIGDLEGEVPTVLRAADCGYCVVPGAAAELAALIRNLADNPQVAQGLGATARAVFERRFDRAIAARRWSAVLRSL